MKLLAIDSSASPASAAIAEDGRLLAEFFLHTGLTHSQTLMPMIDSVLKLSGLSIEDLGLIAVTKGPGSFTGVRIGVASAKGLAMPYRIPCLGVSALEAIAYNFYGDPDDKIICACMDARCGQVYNAMFEIRNGEVLRLTPDRTIPISELLLEAENFEGALYLAGDGAELCHESFSQFGAMLVPEQQRYQRAFSVALAAKIHFEAGESQTASELQPLYLQLPQAQRELNQRKNGK